MLISMLHISLPRLPNHYRPHCISGWIRLPTQMLLANQNILNHSIPVVSRDTVGFGESLPTALTAKSQPVWIVFAAVRAMWEYSTLSGQVVARNQPDVPDNAETEYLITLDVARVGARWHVTVSPFLASPAGPACAAANAYIFQNTSLQTAEPNSTQSVTWEFASGSKSAAGCLTKAFLTSEVQNTQSPKPIAICLYRFGILIAIDKAAHRYWSTLPMADAYEQNIARQLETLPAYL
jgi:hypothetical protein